MNLRSNTNNFAGTAVRLVKSIFRVDIYEVFITGSMAVITIVKVVLFVDLIYIHSPALLCSCLSRCFILHGYFMCKKSQKFVDLFPRERKIK